MPAIFGSYPSKEEQELAGMARSYKSWSLIANNSPPPSNA